MIFLDTIKWYENDLYYNLNTNFWVCNISNLFKEKINYKCWTKNKAWENDQNKEIFKKNPYNNVYKLAKSFAEDQIISIDSDSWIEIDSDNTYEALKISKIKTSHQINNLNEELKINASEKTTIEDIFQPRDIQKPKVRKDVLCKNFARQVKRHYSKLFKEYKEVHLRKYKSKPNSREIYTLVCDFCEEHFKEDKRLTSLPIYLFAMIDKEVFTIWRK